MEKIKINMVDRKAVAIIKSNTHTYNVRFIKSGKFMEVKKCYVKSVYITPKHKSIYKSEKPITQTQLNLGL